MREGGLVVHITSGNLWTEPNIGSGRIYNQVGNLVESDRIAQHRSHGLDNHEKSANYKSSALRYFNICLIHCLEVGGGLHEELADVGEQI